MNKLMTTLAAAVFATTTFGAFAQAPAKSDAPKAAPATPATPAKADAGKATPATPATPAAAPAKGVGSPKADAPKGKAKGEKKTRKAKSGKKSGTEKK